MLELFAAVCQPLISVVILAQPLGRIVALQSVCVYHRLTVAALESFLGHGTGPLPTAATVFALPWMLFRPPTPRSAFVDPVPIRKEVRSGCCSEHHSKPTPGGASRAARSADGSHRELIRSGGLSGRPPGGGWVSDSQAATACCGRG